MIKLQCFWCERFRGENPNPVCDAFPDGIPDKIFLGEIDHTKPYKGDNGLTYVDNPDLLRE